MIPALTRPGGAVAIAVLARNISIELVMRMLDRGDIHPTFGKASNYAFSQRCLATARPAGKANHQAMACNIGQG